MLTETGTLLRELVRRDSVNPPGNEDQVAACLRDWLADRAIAAEIVEFAPGRVNLLARVRGPIAGPRLVLNTHLDVVPAGDGWSCDAFSGEVANGRLFGRGAADAKGSLAAMASALVALRDRGHFPRGEVVLAAVADEEGGSAGARALLQDFAADAAVIGEPTALRLLTAHKGSLRPIVEVRGRASHAAHPEQGVNAIDGLADLLPMLRAYARELGERPHPLVGAPTIVPVLIEGGEAPNMVAERCRLTLDRRLVPGEQSDQVLAEIGAILDQFMDAYPATSASIVDLAPTTGGPSETPADDPFVAMCGRALRRIGQEGQLGGLRVNCDMTHFRAAGIPTVIYGPGDPAAMHVANESLALDDLARAVDGYVAIAEDLIAGGAP